MKDYYIMRISPIHFNQSINLIDLILKFSHVKMLKTVTTKQNLNCSPSATFLTARSVLVKRSLTLSLQLSCETGEAISIRKTSLQVWGLLQSSLRFGVSWGVWRASKVSSSPPLTTSLSLCAVQSVDHLGEMEEEDRVPIQLTLSARQCIFLPSVCAKDRASNRAILERQKHT